MEFLLLGLIGLAVTWGVVEAVRDDGDDSAPEQPIDPDLAQDLTGTSNALLEAGGGNDTITAGSDGTDVVENATLRGGAGDDLFNLVVSESEVFAGQGNDTITGYADGSVINGGHGDDTFDIIANVNTTVNGGLGDDTIIAEGERSWIYGGDGDDVIDGTQAAGLFNSDVYGGAGDDRLIAHSFIQDQGNVRLYGGEGEDTLRVHTAHEPDLAVNLLHGGVGEDVFEIVFTPPSHAPENWSGRVETLKQLVRIDDFQPGKDELHLELGANGAGVLPEVTLHSTSLGTSVNITYTALHDAAGDGAEVPVAMTSEIWLPGVQNVTMADIRIMPPAAA